MLAVNVLWAVLWIAPQALALESCAGQSFGSRAVDPENSRSYILCLGFLGQIKSTCNDGYRFDAQSQGCLAEKQAIHKTEREKEKVEAKKEGNIKQKIQINNPLIFNIFGNFNFFGRHWGNSQESTTPEPPQSKLLLSKFSVESSPEEIVSNSVDSLLQKDLYTLGALSSVIQPADLSTEDSSYSSSESPSSTEPAPESSTPENGHDSETTAGQEEDVASSSKSPLSTEASTAAAEESSSTESAMERSTEDSEPSSENPLTTEASVEDISSSSEDPLSTSAAEDSSSTESPSESSTEESDSSSENPLTTEASVEDISSSSEDPLSTSAAEDSSSTESPSESSTEESDSSSENPLTTDASVEDISSSSEDPLSTSAAEDSSSTESPSESSTEESISSSENPLTTDASVEDISSTSEDPLSTNAVEDSSSTESPSESSTEESISSSENPLTTDASSDDSSSTEASLESSTEDNQDSTEYISSTEPEPESSTEASSESSTEESISSSEGPSTPEPPSGSSAEPNDSSTEISSESPLSTEPSQSTEIESSTESSSESSTEAISSTEISPSESSTEGDNTDPVESSTEESISSTESSDSSTRTTDNNWGSGNDNDGSHRSSTEPSPQNTTEENVSSSANPLTTEPTSESTTEENVSSSATPCTTVPFPENSTEIPGSPSSSEPSQETTEKDSGSGNAGSENGGPGTGTSTEPSLQSSTEENISSSSNPPTDTPCTTVPPPAYSTAKSRTSLELPWKLLKDSVNVQPEERTICSNLPNGVFLREPNSCNKYYICLNGKPIPGKCPNRLNFDIKRKVCNFAYFVDCSFNEVTDTTFSTEPPGYTTSTSILSVSTEGLLTTTQPQEVSLKSVSQNRLTKNSVNQLSVKTKNNSTGKREELTICRNLPNGVFLRDLKSCNKFYICLNRKAVSGQCPRNLNFDIRAKVCKFPSLVDCSVIEDPEDKGPPKEPKEGSVPDCSSERNGVHFHDPMSCSRFYVCANGLALLRQCPRGLYFDFKMKYCNYPTFVECSVEETSVNKPEPLVGESIPHCGKASEGKAFGDIIQHNKYYVCLNGMAVVHYCSPGEWFDRPNSKCVDHRLAKLI
ncbi:hypothetical protein KR038_008861 [Drosophila bunnanda]|nr:hypothetical protein KR038_008861 [Drosophila bunnanda]